MLAVQLLLLATSLFDGRLHAETSCNVDGYIERISGPAQWTRISFGGGQSLQVQLPAGEYRVQLNGDLRWSGNTSASCGVSFRMALGGLASTYPVDGALTAFTYIDNTPSWSDVYFGGAAGGNSGHASMADSENIEACWGESAPVVVAYSANSSAAGFGSADSSGIFLSFSLAGNGFRGDSPCQQRQLYGASLATVSARFVLPQAIETTIVTDWVNGDAPPVYPDETVPAPPGGCEWQPTFVFNNVLSDVWLAVPSSGPAIRFEGRDSTRFTAISNFPEGPIWVDVEGTSHGPFTRGQSFSFAGFTDGSVSSFSVRPSTGSFTGSTAFQLALNAPTGTCEAKVVGPSDVRVDLERLSQGLPPSMESPQFVTRGETVRFAARVPGNCANTYQWQRNSVPIPGETGPTLTLTDLTSEQYGAFSVAVHNELGTAESPALALEPLLYTLTVNAAGGTVTKSPDLAGYEPGTVVTLQATPEAGFAFVGWDGDVHSTANPVEITLNQNTTVTAWFANPFGGTPRTLPGRIEAEDFDEGGEGVAYHDTSAENQGGSTYRTESVDVGARDGGLAVVWSDTGEWLNYTVNVTEPGTYRAVLRVSAGGSGGTGQLRFGGGAPSDPIIVPSTGSWYTFTEVTSAPFTLTAGDQVMRFEYVQAGFDLNWIELQRVNIPPVADAGGPYTIEEGSSLILNGSATDPDLASGDSLTFSWDLNDDGTFGDATGASPEVAPAQLAALGLGAGTRTIHLRVTDLAGTSDTASTTLTIVGTQTITFDPVQNFTYGDAPITVSATASSGLPVTFTSLTPSVATVSGSTVTIVGAGTATIRASQAGDANWQAAPDVDQTFTVAKATPVLTWSNPADIMLGTALDELQLNATANVPGTFTYDPPAGTLLYSGEGQVLMAAFMPADSGNYRPVWMTTTINVLHDLAGSAWSWGYNLYGQLGDGRSGSSAAPVAVSAPAAWIGHTIVSVAAGGSHSLAVLDDGSVWAWGSGSIGQLGNGQTANSAVPVPVSAPVAWNGHTVVSVAAGGSHSLAVLDDGSVWAWGYGGNGQLGNGQTVPSLLPVAVSAPAAWNGHRVVRVVAGSNHSLAVLDDGSVWAWGAGSNGQLGNGQTVDSSVPVPVSAPVAWNGHRVVNVAPGNFHNLAVLDDGSVWAWGSGGNGRLGNGQTGDSSVPVAVSAPAAWNGHTVVSVAAGGSHSLAVLDDGSVWAWGYGGSGQLGNGQTANSAVPVPVSAPVAWNGHTVVSVAAGGSHSLAVLDDGSVWAWGSGGFGQLGHGQTVNSSVPVAVSAPASWNGRRVVSVEAGSFHSLVVLAAANATPVLVNPIANQNATYGSPFTFTVPVNTFSDADAGQALSYSVSGLPAWLSFDAETRTFSGAPTAVGTFTLTVTATDNGTPPLSASTTFDLMVGKAALTATGDTLYRFYGEANPPLTGTLEGVVNGDNITASYGTTATTTSPAGVYTIYVVLNDPDDRLGNYEVTTVTGALRVETAPQTITFGAIPTHVYGDAPFTVPVSASSGLPVTLTSSAASVATVNETTLTITGAGTTLLTAYQPGDGNYQAAAFVQTSYTVGKATPVITWATPADINCQTVLGAAQLNATVNAPGTLTYHPPAGTSLPLGEAQLLSVTFTPADPANWHPASASVTVAVRLDAGLAALWERPIAQAAFVSLGLTPDGYVGLAGYSWDSSIDVAVAKVSATDGTVLWDKRYNSAPAAYDEGTAGTVDAEGNVIVTGYSNGFSGNHDYLTAKYAAADGALLWMRHYNGPANANDQARAVAVDAAGNVVVTGRSWNGSNWDIVTLKFAAADGALLWEHRYNGPANNQDYGIAIAVDSAGNLIVGGSSAGDYYIAKHAGADGSVLWQATYHHGDDAVMAMALDAEDNVIVTGYSSGPGTGYDYYTAKYASFDGALLWGVRYNSPQNRDEFGGWVVVDPAGDIIVAGHANNGVSNDYLMVKYGGANGAVLWERRLANNLGFLEGRMRLAVDPSGNVAFTGLYRHTDNRYEEYTAACRITDGTLLWEHRAPTTANIPRPVAVSADGDVLTTGNGIVQRLRFGTRPTLTLIGPEWIELGLGTDFTDPGAEAVDGCGSALAVSVIGSVDLSAAGDYLLTYTATDAAGQTVLAHRRVSVLVTDQPPVAVAGDDQNVVADVNCMAIVTVDGSASSDPDGDPISFGWELFVNGEPLDTVVGEAAVAWELPIGIYQARLTVFTDVAGSVVASSDSLMIQVLPSAPMLAALEPTAAYANGPAFELTVTGGCFLEGATVYWTGAPRPTTWVGLNELRAAIPASDLQTGVDIFVAPVQVVNGDGQVSNPLGFSVVVQSVGTVDATVSQPGETTTVSTAPQTAGEPGATVTVENAGDEPVTVLSASYDERPVGETVFQVDNGSFVDVQIAGDPDTLQHVSATVFFYYPSTTTGGMENRVKLRYFDGANWIPVLSSGGLPPGKDTTDNLDGTISGGRFTVIFDLTSTPTILELGGTVFGMFESQPQLQAVYGPEGPVALGQSIEVGVEFAVLGDADAVRVHFQWNDGTASTVIPAVAGGAGSASAMHLYGGPGVYPVIVRVVDAEGDEREGRFEYVVIYDPNGGFVTGGGWIQSPAGAYAFDPTLTGRASFGFNAKYRKGQSVPDGQTQFQFQAGDFRFHSTAYEWLVVSGAKAQYKGVGQVNGVGDYGFLLTATDGQLSGGGGVDKFRIKIWDRASGMVVYDNRPGITDDLAGADPQALGGGSIVIHTTR